MSLNPFKSLAANKTLVPQKVLLLAAASVVLIVAACAALITVLNPLPPRTLAIACGPVGSSSESFAKRYQKMLAGQGIKLELVNTAGGVENMALLKDPKSKVQLGFVDGGIIRDTEDDDLVSLGTLGYDPVWFFTRVKGTDKELFSLEGQRVSVGPAGSDSRALVEALIKRKALERDNFQSLTLTTEDTQAAFLSRKIDAAVMVNSWASPVVRKLVTTEGVDIVDFVRADAYVARFSFFTKRVVPQGAADLEENLPDHDVTVLALKTSLLARKNLHPALQYAMLDVISKVHSRAGVFQKAREFPSAEEIDTPLSASAMHYYKNGRPWLQRYLPFWLAVLVQELWMLLLPVIGLSYPAVKSIMWFYGWRMQRKVFLVYGELFWLERQMDKAADGPVPPELLDRLRAVEEKTARLKVPPKYLPMLYGLKEDLGHVRGRLESRR